jgi:hypothetical protein
VTGPVYKRGGGVVPIDILAAENGQTVAEAQRSMAELSAHGIVRLALGPEGETTKVRVTRYLTVLNEGGDGGCHMLFLAQPASTLSASKRRRLAGMLARVPDLGLGSVAMLCASVRLANGVGFVPDEALSDYLGVKRGSFRADRDDGVLVDLLRPGAADQARRRAAYAPRRPPVRRHDGRHGPARPRRAPDRHGEPLVPVRLTGTAGRLDP